jgi:hypothetical protein
MAYCGWLLVYSGGNNLGEKQGNKPAHSHHGATWSYQRLWDGDGGVVLSQPGCVWQFDAAWRFNDDLDEQLQPDLFVDLSAMTLQSWLQTPLSDHFNAWGSALGLNLANLLIFQGGIILLPFMVIGVIRWWKFIWVKFFTGMGLLTLLVMTVVFPFSGSRGGFIHSGAALQVFAWLMGLPGLEGFAEWLKRKRGLPVVTSQTVFSVFLTLAMAGISFWAVSNRVIGTNVHEPIWTESERKCRP